MSDKNKKGTHKKDMILLSVQIAELPCEGREVHSLRKYDTTPYIHTYVW